jgi:hypothetical protein
LILTLVPPQPETEQMLLGKPENTVSELLVKAIVAASDGVASAADRPPPLRLVDMKVKFNFVVQSDASIGVGFKILPVVEVEGSGDLSNKAVQTIVVEFAYPPKKKP